MEYYYYQQAQFEESRPSSTQQTQQGVVILQPCSLSCSHVHTQMASLALFTDEYCCLRRTFASPVRNPHISVDFILSVYPLLLQVWPCIYTERLILQGGCLLAWVW